MSNRDDLPLVYSCSGCSNIAQLANKIAVDLDRANIAEMSCIAGVGGNVPALVKKAKSGRDIISIDGCQLQCVKNCLSLHDIQPTLDYTLTEYGIKKRYQVDYHKSDVLKITTDIILAIDG